MTYCIFYFYGSILIFFLSASGFSDTGMNAQILKNHTDHSERRSENILKSQQNTNVNCYNESNNQKAKSKDEVMKISDQSSSQAFLLYITFGLSILSIILVLRVIRLIKQIPVWIKSSEFKKYIIDDIIIDSYKNKREMYNLLENLLRKSTTPNAKTEQKKVTASVEIKEEDIDKIVKLVLKKMEIQNKLDVSVFKEPFTFKDAKVPLSKTFLYASSADSNKNSFFKTTVDPDEDTVYKLIVIGNMADFVLHEGANSKVIKAPDFLECACEVQKIGNTTVITTQPGKAEKTSDGIWVITAKAKIKIN